jgi:hypothetical protein
MRRTGLERGTLNSVQLGIVNILSDDIKIKYQSLWCCLKGTQKKIEVVHLLSKTDVRGK